LRDKLSHAAKSDTLSRQLEVDEMNFSLVLYPCVSIPVGNASSVLQNQDNTFLNT